MANAGATLNLTGLRAAIQGFVGAANAAARFTPRTTGTTGTPVLRGRGAANISTPSTLGAFFARSEFTGRAGSLARGLAAGNLAAAGLAFVTIDQAGRYVLEALRGAEAREIMGNVFDLLVPSLLKNTVPQILDELLDRKERDAELARAREALRAINVQKRIEEDAVFRQHAVRVAGYRYANTAEHARYLREARAHLSGG